MKILFLLMRRKQKRLNKTKIENDFFSVFGLVELNLFVSLGLNQRFLSFLENNFL